MDLEDISDRVKDSKAESLVKVMAFEDVRLKLLYLQSLSKLLAYRDISKSDAKALEKFRVEIKDVEGVVGDYGRRRDLLATAKKGGARAEILKVLTDQQIPIEREAFKKLEALGWAPSPEKRIRELMTEVAKLDFGPRSEESAAIADGMRKLIADQKNDLKDRSRYFKSDSFTEVDLENGIHTVRRDLRWILNSLTAAEGVFVLDNRGLAADRALIEKYGDSKYIRFVKVASVEPIPVSRIALVQLAMLVQELGVLKDFKEAELDYATFLLSTGFTKNEKAAHAEAHELMIRAAGKDVDVEGQARSLYSYYLSVNPLKEISRDLEHVR